MTSADEFGLDGMGYDGNGTVLKLWDRVYRNGLGYGAVTGCHPTRPHDHTWVRFKHRHLLIHSRHLRFVPGCHPDGELVFGPLQSYLASQA